MGWRCFLYKQVPPEIKITCFDILTELNFPNENPTPRCTQEIYSMQHKWLLFVSVFSSSRPHKRTKQVSRWHIKDFNYQSITSSMHINSLKIMNSWAPDQKTHVLLLPSHNGIKQPIKIKQFCLWMGLQTPIQCFIYIFEKNYPNNFSLFPIYEIFFFSEKSERI